ncbi:unnamed protein product [Spirodela intermedia]|uniref:Uncharacterized protein n=1 Tax=Spirodela intermedia TaxID=51605 RepID=A0A7I8KHN0_SPIIN|nr:unnamed protein product [Spirodela intermedia]
MAHVSDIKLIRTDTTLDLSQKAEKDIRDASCTVGPIPGLTDPVYPERERNLWARWRVAVSGNPPLPESSGPTTEGFIFKKLGWGPHGEGNR